MYMPTPGSTAKCGSDWPMPRMKIAAVWPKPEAPLLIATFGAALAAAAMSPALRLSRASAEMAVIAIGVSCRRC
jgi:hypothetical protein